ncbi:MAG: DinB family protein [Chloroflexi bacterium]|nr:DinB family protein [Chloroflexota bacterium]
MDIKEYVALELDGIRRGLTKILDGLSQQELSWRPASGCNSIGLILFHMLKFEDTFVQARLQGKEAIWTADKWYQKLNMAEAEAGAHYTADQVNAFPVPELKGTLAYFDAVRTRTENYFKGLSSETFGKKIQTPRFGEVTIAFMVSFMIGHEQQHVGEISYLRGLQRGADK